VRHPSRHRHTSATAYLAASADRIKKGGHAALTAKHRAIVEFQGRHFRAHYYPAKETPRGQPVKKWLREWSEVRDAPAALAVLATVEPTATSARESTTDAP
ncbi:hypothetical protein ACI2KH_25075, partial [Roseomonas mucosa]|uniref:hypothetical protein n=1 Tax=Roseomonas mucosa TaxID=207340 RepID=UPI0038500E39